MWTFIQSTGQLLDSTGIEIAIGYSGLGIGKDNPDEEGIKGIGPIPCGFYQIGKAINHTKLGELAMPLTPNEDNEMFGRNGFYIHGDSLQHPGQASEGCIVMPGITRLKIDGSDDKTLEVVV